MKIRRIGFILFGIVLLAVGMTGCSDLWTLNVDNPIRITTATTFLVTADGEDPLDARTQVEQVLTKWKYRMITAENADANTLHLIICYEYLPENQFCRHFTFTLRDAAGKDLKVGYYLGEKSLQDLLVDFNQFILKDSLFQKQ